MKRRTILALSAMTVLYRKVGQRNDYNLGHRTSGQVDLKTLSRERLQFH
jgi:hypothetical protein